MRRCMHAVDRGTAALRHLLPLRHINITRDLHSSHTGLEA